MNNFFDLTLANIRQGIKEANLDPIQLPHDADQFTVKVIYNIYIWKPPILSELTPY